MDDFYKYLTVSKSDIDWGLYLTVAGKSEVQKNSLYPLPELSHPYGYNFKWENGRFLREYQIHYFTKGRGILENSYGKYKIFPGSVMITYPGVWHRFRPLKTTGWIENYVGFSGEIADRIFDNSFFNIKKPVIYCELRKEVIDSFYKIFDLVKNEAPGFHYVASGMLLKLLGYIISFQSQIDFHGKHIQTVIEDIRTMLRENVEKDFDFKKIAFDYNVGYSYFRKMFKKYTGISPKQYLIQLKIIRAKELLLNSDLAVKEIAFELGFQSVFYFSRIFKEKTSMTPSNYRKH